MRYHLRTLLILLAIVPPMLAIAIWAGYGAYSSYQRCREAEWVLQQVNPSAKLARPAWWIFEQPIPEQP